jgi:maleate cis-trans isomerase
MLEYGFRGLIGLLTPQSNTTVEPEFWIMAPAGANLINARLVSQAGAMNDRLVDYAWQAEATLEQFGNAPLSAVAFACTGSSYLIGAADETGLIERLEAKMKAPFVTAARAITEALRTLSAHRIALISPYSPDLTTASVDYWRRSGLEIAQVIAVAPPPNSFHPIYGIDARSVGLAIDAVAAEVDAILLLGTGMPTLGPILERAGRGGALLLSSNLCLGWLAISRACRVHTDRDGLMAWIGGAGWAERLLARRTPDGCPDRAASGTISSPFGQH